MKLIKLIMVFSAIALLSSCSKDKKEEQEKKSTFKEVVTLSSEGHSVVVSSKNGKLVAGYNPLQVQIKDKSGNPVKVSKLSWMPMMTMVMKNKEHSCPFSSLEMDKEIKNTYNGFILFQMPSMGDKGFWDLTISYSVGDKSYTTEKKRITVNKPNGKNQWVNVKDGYVFGLVEPKDPKVGVNDMVVALYKMNMQTHSFDVVEGGTILIDPRMPDPSMNNHSSPDNINLTQNNQDGFYHGKVNFTMTGYWKINLQFQNKEGEVILGEPVTDNNEASSVYLNIEF